MRTLSLADLANFPRRTMQQQITIALLAEYYEAYLHLTYYNIELANGVTMQLDFHKENFCHLIGIGQIAEEHFPQSDDRLYLHKGKRGFKRAKSGRITFGYLRNLHQHQYAIQEEKFYFFHFLHTMMESGNLKVTNFNIVSNSQITCDFMFHDTYDNALIHLGVEYDLKRGKFFPKTFFPRYLTLLNFDKYIDPQNLVDIVKVTKIPRT